MSMLPSSLALTLHTQRRACVLDTHLALSPHGLLLARRLSDELNLWLVRELWQILDDTTYYLSYPQKLIPSLPGRDKIKAFCPNPKSVRDVLIQWDLARVATDLSGLKVHWLGDALNESLLPAGTDPDLISRFETLAAALERRTCEEFADDVQRERDIFSDCFRDTAALTAALIHYKGFILTMGSTETEPLLCTYLKERFALPCRMLNRKETRLECDFLNSILARTALSELLWAGLQLAAVHLVVPGAVMMPGKENPEDTFRQDFTLPSEETGEHEQDWWADALCFWYPIGS